MLTDCVVDELPYQIHHASLQSYQALFDLWTQGSRSRRQTTIDDYWKVCQSFADFVGRKPLVDITRRDLVGFHDQLLEDGQSPLTASRKIGILKSLFVTAINHELMDTNPADSFRAQTRQQVKQRVAFSADELSRIFSSAIYTDNYLPKGAGHEAAYWLPLLALYTGARVEELAQLMVGDIKYVDGLGHYINICDDAAHQQLKNSSSRRRIPIHPVLIACGFIDYVGQQQKSSLLFPHLKANTRGKLGGYFSNFFSGYLRQKVKISDSRKVFHSFRHTFKDACRQVGIEEAVHDALTGHTGKSVGRKYGNEQYPLEPLFEAMERYEIAGLDLSHLYTRPYIQRLRPADVKMVSAFYGVVVAFTANKNKRDVAPFIVAIWQGNEAAFNIASNQVIWGYLPQGKQMLVNAWIEIHREELLADWMTGKQTGVYFPLPALR